MSYAVFQCPMQFLISKYCLRWGGAIGNIMKDVSAVKMYSFEKTKSYAFLVLIIIGQRFLDACVLGKVQARTNAQYIVDSGGWPLHLRAVQIANQ